MKFLKTFFQREADTFAIRAMSSVELVPDEGYEEDFFKAKNAHFHHDSIINGLPNFGVISDIVGQSIVPVVSHVPGETTLRCLGTGFFISCTGLLVTAAHIVSDPIERDYGDPNEIGNGKIHYRNLELGIMIPLNRVFFGAHAYMYREIEWSFFLGERRENPLPIKGIDLKLSADIAICKVEQKSKTEFYQPLTVVQKGIKGVGLAIGKNARAVGYGDMRDIELHDQGPNALSGDAAFNLHVSQGQILQRFPDNITTKQATAPGPCFSAEMRLPGGMSGSPVFDDEGLYVHGVVSRGLEDETGLAPYGYGCMLGPSLAVPLTVFDGKSIFDLDSVKHGITQISAPDI